ncbi:MAG: CapA family protein [Candidatus Kapaibacterium sp.]
MKYIYLLIIPILIFLSSCDRNNLKETSNSSSIKDTVNKITDDTITIIGVGDIMMGTTYPSSDLPPDDGRELFDGVKDILRNADITTGNLEGPFLNSGGTPKECETPERCYSFRMPERYAEYLNDAGFDYVNLANNHAFDMGTKGRETTYSVLDGNGILYAGTTDFPTTIKEVKGLKIGFAGFAPNRGTININNERLVEETIIELKSKCDILVVMFHGGAEGSGAQNVFKRKEIFLGENRGDVYDFAHRVIDNGADIVFGHGPHVSRAVEIYKDKFIAYSLGNFCTYGKFSLAGVQGIAPLIKVFMNKNGKFIKAEITSIKQVKRGFPIIDENETALKTIVRLTETDFGKNAVRFDGNMVFE